MEKLSRLKIFLVFSLVIILVPVLIMIPSVRADEVDDLQKQIDDLARMKQMSEDATKPLEGTVLDLEKKINSAQAGIKQAQSDAVQVAEGIAQREQELGYYYTLLQERIFAEYKQLRTENPMDTFLQTQLATAVFQKLAYHSAIRTENSALIEDVEGKIIQLETDKKNLEEKQKRLAALQIQLDGQADFFKGEIAKAKAYQQELTGKIAELSTRQRAILDARSGSRTTSVGDVPLADDFNASIGYKAQAPANSFAVFSFGAYTHRNGMSQYGAKARAEAGQSVEEILQAYYPGSTLKKDYNSPDQISVQGVGTISFEGQYLQGIYEMPGSWPMNALKAQAVAARTFALRYTNNGAKSICTTESCQVFKNSKKGGDWESAVNDTRGWVLVDGAGNPISTQYASTHGGYSKTGGWDTTDGNGEGDWSNKAWEAKANSPWFYKAWYRTGYSSSSDACGRSHPWLSQEEFADIINGWIVRKNPNGADPDRVLPITIDRCGGGGGNPYSMDELRSLANNSGGAVTSISSVTVSHNNSAQTSSVRLETNRGTITISGDEFKTAFNLRAPGYIRIPQTGFAFFIIEHKQ